MLVGVRRSELVQLEGQAAERLFTLTLAKYRIRLLTDELQSSLTLALLRCILTEGNVYYDGVATDKVNLDILRRNITIIPQVVCGMRNSIFL